jgi:polyisoprenyl-phosphate glycosyltransferase
MEKIAILLPCYNESSLIKKIEILLLNNIKDLPFLFEIVFINDGSTDETSNIISTFNTDLSNVNITLLNLDYNCGHQKAILAGLQYVQNIDFQNILVMDADGEDDPEAIHEILKYRNYDYVQVIRGKRKEILWFRIMYYIYKKLFKILIGKKINFGNYSLINKKLVNAAVDNTFLHYAAFLNNQKCLKKTIIWDRAKRLDGKSKMSFISLFYHAINSMIENSEQLLFFFIKISFFILFGIIILVCVVLYKKFISFEAVTGWSSSLISTLFNSFLICIGIFIIGIIQSNILNKIKINKIQIRYNILSIVKNWS